MPADAVFREAGGNCLIPAWMSDWNPFVFSYSCLRVVFLKKNPSL